MRQAFLLLSFLSLATFFMLNYSACSSSQSTVKLNKDYEFSDEQTITTYIVKALFERAIGYKQDEVYISSYRGQIKKTSYVKGYPPDPTSMIFWLKNRQPEHWREKQLIEQVGSTQEELRNMTDEELDDSIKSLMKDLNLKLVPIQDE